jgi:hypothetical protein
MAGTSAHENELGIVHKLLTERLTAELKKKKCDVKWIQAATKFLHDNKVYQIKDVGDGLDELDKSLSQRKQRFGKENITDIATELAKKEAVG